MSILRVFTTESYKILHRKSSLLLLLPALLALLIGAGYSRGVITLAVTNAISGPTSCMDLVLLVWTLLSGLGVVALILVLFAALQFSGERDGGQIKLMLLRIGPRRDVVLGKFLALIACACCTILLTLLACALSYVLFVAPGQTAPSFSTTIAGLNDAGVLAAMALQTLTLLGVLALTMLIGLWCGPFVTFVLAMLVFYTCSYLAGGANALAHLLPLHWSNALLAGVPVAAGDALLASGCALALAALLLIASCILFRHRDVR